MCLWHPVDEELENCVDCLEISLVQQEFSMGWLRLVGSLKLQVSFADEPYKRDYILQKKYLILRSLLIVANPQSIDFYLAHR